METIIMFSAEDMKRFATIYCNSRSYRGYVGLSMEQKLQKYISEYKPKVQSVKTLNPRPAHDSESVEYAKGFIRAIDLISSLQK
jgi:hypothetical protein